MRYDPRNRRKFPNRCDMRLWSALDRMEVRHERISWMGGEGTSRLQNWYATSRVWFDEERYGVIEFEMTYHRGHSPDERTKRNRQRLLSYLDEKSIPYLIVPKDLGSYEYEMLIRRWMKGVI